MDYSDAIKLIQRKAEGPWGPGNQTMMRAQDGPWGPGNQTMMRA